MGASLWQLPFVSFHCGAAHCWTVCQFLTARSAYGALSGQRDSTLLSASVEYKTERICNSMKFNATQCNSMRINAIRCDIMQGNAIQIEINRQRDRQKDRQIDRQRDRQIDTQIDRWRDRHTDPSQTQIPTPQSPYHPKGGLIGIILYYIIIILYYILHYMV